MMVLKRLFKHQITQDDIDNSYIDLTWWWCRYEQLGSVIRLLEFQVTINMFDVRYQLALMILHFWLLRHYSLRSIHEIHEFGE